MLLGIQVPYFTWPGGPAQLGQTFGASPCDAEEAGFASFWVMDHFFQIRGVGPAEDEMLEGYTRPGLRRRASPSGSRSARWSPASRTAIPALLVKTVTTLDVLSGGRAWFGVGAAWYEREHVGLGVPVPAGRRALRAAGGDAADRATRCGRATTAPYDGTHYRLGGAAQLARSRCSGRTRRS